jgi:hypothetical protein
MEKKPASEGAAAKPKPGADASLSELAADSGYRTSSTAALKVGSVELSQEIAAVVLEQTIAGHHRLEVDINQEEATGTMDTAFTDLAKFTGMLGEALSLTIEADLVSTPEPERQTFTGIVTEVRLDNSVNELNRVKIIAMSPTIALDGARLDQFFYDNTASDIVKSVLANYPITLGSVDAAGKQMPFCVQYRETDFDLVLRLAASVGLIAFYDGEKFYATKPSSSNPTKLVWRESLGSFALGLGTAQKEYKSAVYNYQKSKSPPTPPTKCTPSPPWRPASPRPMMSAPWTTPSLSSEAARSAGWSKPGALRSTPIFRSVTVSKSPVWPN